MTNSAIDETQSRITCGCGEVFQVLQHVMVMKQFEVFDDEGNVINYYDEEVLEAQWNEEETSKIYTKHCETCDGTIPKDKK